MPARPGNRKHKTIAGAAEAAPAGQRLPVDLAAHHGLHAPAGPHLAGIVDKQFDDRVVADLAALADAVMAVRARQRVLRTPPPGQRGIRRARGGVLEPDRKTTRLNSSNYCASPMASSASKKNTNERLLTADDPGETD